MLKKRAHQKALRRAIDRHFKTLYLQYPYMYRRLTRREITEITRKVISEFGSHERPKAVTTSLDTCLGTARATWSHTLNAYIWA